jgi:hypothetical protein
VFIFEIDLASSCFSQSLLQISDGKSSTIRLSSDFKNLININQWFPQKKRGIQGWDEITTLTINSNSWQVREQWHTANRKSYSRPALLYSRVTVRVYDTLTFPGCHLLQVCLLSLFDSYACITNKTSSSTSHTPRQPTQQPPRPLPCAIRQEAKARRGASSCHNPD